MIGKGDSYFQRETSSQSSLSLTRSAGRTRRVFIEHEKLIHNPPNQPPLHRFPWLVLRKRRKNSDAKSTEEEEKRRDDLQFFFAKES